jgi:Heterokaryon incompatibility protein (HET)
MLVFADALCINQSKDPDALAERKAQVELMKTIYPKAESAVVDLGDESHDSNAAVCLLERFCSVTDADWHVLLQGKAKADQFGIPGFHDSAWVSLASFCNREWFRRTWVVEEFALAKELRVLIGDRFKPPEILTKGVARASLFSSFSGPDVVPKYYADASGIGPEQLLCQTIDLRAQAIPLSGRIEFLNAVRASCRDVSSERFPLGRLLYSTKGLSITDRRDRVYALLGMCRDEDISTLIAAYSETVEDLSRLVTNCLIDKQQLFLVLYHLASFDHEGTPSWMINFNIDRWSDALEEMAGVPWQVTAEEEPPFCACGQEPMEFSRESDNLIKLSGHLLDQVSWVSNGFVAKIGREGVSPKSFVKWYHDTF